ncbi:MAG: thioredoxin [Verrucomicrobia bacterium]|nr:thioredoxin [Verrucomicrobiota bacterium]
MTVTRENFNKEVRQAKILVLLDFWAEWCAPCRELDPILEKLAAEFAGRIKICKINADDQPGLVAQHVPDNIFPCLILMKNGKMIERRYGTDPKMNPEAFLRRWITANLSAQADTR